MDPMYQNKLRDLMNNPGSFQGTPGFKFALDTGLDAVNRSNSASRGSGNALAALTKYGTGLAAQDYGNEFDRLLRGSGQEQQFQIGTDANANTATRNANDLSLGTTRNANDLTLGLGANANSAARNANDLTLGLGANANTATRNANDRTANDQQFGLGMYRAGNDFRVASDANTNTANRDWWNYDLGRAGNANTAANNENNFNINNGRNAIDWYGANTQRGAAQGNQWLGEQRNQRDWIPYGPPRYA